CEIYTDVDGVYTTDPRLLPEARQVKQVAYDEMLELASLGAGVMHNRSIEFAKKFNVPIHVRSSFSDVPGTMIVPSPESDTRPVSGCAMTRDEARITIDDVPDRPGVSQAIFSAIAARNITVDMIVQNVGAAGRANISFTVLRSELPATLRVLDGLAASLGAAKVTHDDQVSKISVVGLGMAKQTGVADKMFRALANAGINITMITTSEIKISALVAREKCREALHAVHSAFKLHKRPTEVNDPAQSAAAAREADISAVVERLRAIDSIEGLAIDDVRVDTSQARVTVSGVPDKPGIAADIFETVARANVMVDMIVQSFGKEGTASISFTMPKDQLNAALAATEEVAKRDGCASVTSSPQVAKLSVSGIGMRSHTGVAVRMFGALAEAGINVELINTSEVRVNVIVAGDAGEKGLAVLQAAFADADI
ncbi:MAG: aspartate kinase, partial [Planctomycetales bacterium]|nr:aspartate kinase [Planctomycetales bacterium]